MKMFFKKCDLISPRITLYFKGESIHSSIFAGVLTIVSYLTIFSLSIYYTIGYIYRSNPNIYFYTRFVEEAGTFPLNSSSLFHFIRLGDTNNNQAQDIDFKSIRVIGMESPIDHYMSDNNLTKFNHWLYGPCNNDDMENMNDLVKVDFPEKSACIRQYFNAEHQKYYNTKEKNFRWPALIHGCSNNNAVNYGIIMEKCRNDSLTNYCKSKIEIDYYLEHLYGILYFIDTYAEVLNFENPYTKYLYKLTNGFFSHSFTVNNLNFNPSLIGNNDGAFVKYKFFQKSFQFTQNEKSTLVNSDNTDILVSFYFWMQNTEQYYDRNYERFQDLLSDIGGINSFIIFIAKIINTLVVHYIILLDTEELVLDTDKYNFAKEKFHSKPTILKKASEILNPPKFRNNKFKNHTINKKQQNSVFQILLRERLDLNAFNNNINIDAKSEPFKHLNFRNANEFNLSRNLEKKQTNNCIIPMNIFKEENNNIKNENIDKKIISDSKNISMTIKDSIHELETEIKQEENKPIKKQNFSFFNYIFYILTCKKINPKIKYYENFRRQIISEENIIQNHINIFKLLSECNIDNVDPFKLKNIDSNFCCPF